MRDHFSLFIAPILAVLGGVVVYDGMVSHDASQSMRVLGGAALLALGLIQFQQVLKNWWRFRTRPSRDASRNS